MKVKTFGQRMNFGFFFVILIVQLNKSKGIENSCVYNSSSYGIIDLTQLGHKDGTPRWKNQIPDLPEQHGFILFDLIKK